MTEQNNWLHLELDQGTNIDGIDLFKFRYEWELFFNKGITELLVDKLTEIYSSQNFNGAVVTFASRYVLSREHIEAVKSHIKTVYLFGSKQYCIKSFLERKDETGRDLNGFYWKLNNEMVYELISDSSFRPYRLNVFDKYGKRKNLSDVLKSIKEI